MSFNNSSMPLSAKQITVMDTNNKFDFNHIVQRGLVWEKWRKTYLIDSMIREVPMNKIYCRRDIIDAEEKKKKNNAVYIVMDGQQRITTVASYVRDEYPLTDCSPVEYTNYEGEECKVDISRLKFSELPEELQDKIKDTIFTLVYFEDITPEEEIELFKRLNSGKPLSTKAQQVANCLDLAHVLNIGNHDLFESIFTENSLSQKSQVPLIMKIWAMLNKDIEDISFESKHFNQMIQETIISDEQEKKLLDIFDYIFAVHEYILSATDVKNCKKIARTFYHETNLVSFVPSIKKAVDAGLDEGTFGDMVINFLSETSEEYNNAARNGSAKNENIKIRNRIIAEAYENI